MGADRRSPGSCGLPTFSRIYRFHRRTGPSSRCRRCSWAGRKGAGDLYWNRYRTVPGEACAYAGIVAWILAFVALGRAPVSMLSSLADDRSLLTCSGDVAQLVARRFLAADAIASPGLVPRPARYTLLTSLGLALLAGRGLDRTVASPAVLERIDPGDPGWCDRLVMVDLLGERRPFPSRHAR